MRYQGVAVMLALCGCTEAPPRGWHQSEPRLVISVPSDSGILTEVIRNVMAPPIAFGALVYSDSAHLLPVVAPRLGTLVYLAPAGPVSRDTRIADLRGLDRAAVDVIRADQGGAFTPRRLSGQIVDAGDTVGTIRRQNTWLAVGVVDELSHGAIHEGDPAELQLRNSDGLSFRGVVERVNRPGTKYPYSAEILIEFADTTGMAPLRSATLSAVVHPSHSMDSLLSVPQQAIVHLSDGPGIFVRDRAGTYRFIRVLTGPLRADRVTIRGDVEPGMAAVTSGAMPLATAAAESLALARHRQD